MEYQQYGAWEIDPQLMTSDESSNAEQYLPPAPSELDGHALTHEGEYLSARNDQPHQQPPGHESVAFYPDPSSAPAPNFWESTPQTSAQVQHGDGLSTWQADEAMDIMLRTGERLECLYSYQQDPWQVASQFCMDNRMSISIAHDLAGQLAALRDRAWRLQEVAAPTPPRDPPRRVLKPRAPKKQKIPSKSAIDQSKLPILPAPFSELAKELDAPLFDIETWVSRSSSERHAEVGLTRKVPRPMNSFMLYRKTYNAVNKKWCANTSNNQVISVVTGRSWNLEPEEVQKRFRELARKESKGHELAWPDYKYCPAQRETKRRRDEADEGLSRGAGHCAWSGGYPGR